MLVSSGRGLGIEASKGRVVSWSVSRKARRLRRRCVERSASSNQLEVESYICRQGSHTFGETINRVRVDVND